MESNIDLFEIKSLNDDQFSDQEASESLDHEIFNQSDELGHNKIILFFCNLYIKVKKAFQILCCRRNDEYLTVGERLLGRNWLPGNNIVLFYLSLFFAFAAFINYIAGSNEPFWIYTLFFFVFFITSMIR